MGRRHLRGKYGLREKKMVKTEDGSMKKKYVPVEFSAQKSRHLPERVLFHAGSPSADLEAKRPTLRHRSVADTAAKRTNHCCWKHAPSTLQ